MDPARDRREGPARDHAGRLLRLHPPRPSRRAARALRRDDRGLSGRAGASGSARGRGGTARGENAARSPPGPATEGRRVEEVEGRTAFVTGGASGIGLGMATAFVVGRDERRDRRPTTGQHRERPRSGSWRATGRRACTRSNSTSPTGMRSRARPTRRSAPSATCTSSATTRAWASSGRSRSPGTTTGTGDSACCSAASSTASRRSSRGMLAHGEGGAHRQHVVHGGRPSDAERRDLHHGEGCGDRALGSAAERARGRGNRRLGVLSGAGADEHPRGRKDAAGALRRFRLHGAGARARGAPELAALDGSRSSAASACSRASAATTSTSSRTGSSARERTSGSARCSPRFPTSR